VLALRQGNPFPDVDLGQTNAWFVDWRLTALKNQPNLCKRVLTQLHIEAQPISDSLLKGWLDQCGADIICRRCSRRFRQAYLRGSRGPSHVDRARGSAGRARVSRPAVTALRSYGGYSCRDVVGNPLLKGGAASTRLQTQPTSAASRWQTGAKSALSAVGPRPTSSRPCTLAPAAIFARHSAQITMQHTAITFISTAACSGFASD
jgi:hypothetical protein